MAAGPVDESMAVTSSQASASASGGPQTFSAAGTIALREGIIWHASMQFLGSHRVFWVSTVATDAPSAVPFLGTTAAAMPPLRKGIISPSILLHSGSSGEDAAEPGATASERAGRLAAALAARTAAPCIVSYAIPSSLDTEDKMDIERAAMSWAVGIQAPKPSTAAAEAGTQAS